MKKQLILHIGMGKTGTTALQDFFWLNRGQLRKSGIFYPTYGAVAHAHHLLSPFLPNNLKDRWKFISVAEWAPRLDLVDLDKILLSSELIAWTSKEDVIKFCRSVQQWFELTIVIYLRRQDNIIMANYNQLVKAGSQQTKLDDVWEDDCRRFNYQRILEPWASCVGKSNVIVRPYEEQQFHHGDIRHDFMFHVFGAEVSDNYSIPPGNSNPRLHSVVISYKLGLYKLFSDPRLVDKFNNALLDYSQKLDAAQEGLASDQALLSPLIRNRIIDLSSATNEFIAREYLDRKDGVLFFDPLPDQSDGYRRSKLTRNAARLVTQHCGTFNAHLLKLLYEEIVSGLASIDLSRRREASFLKTSLPKAMIVDINRQKIGTRFGWRRRTAKGDLKEGIPVLFSVHFPAVTVAAYTDELDRKYGEKIMEDYADRPIGSGSFTRNLGALRHCVRYARILHDSDEAVCVHGHFMPLKYRFLQSRLKKRYVTWLRDPAERLQAHYMYWKSDYGQEYSGSLRRRMIEEDWSLEKFAFCPEIRNIYSKYLWCFPLQKFDFVGIAEFPEAEVQRFSKDILGLPPSAVICKNADNQPNRTVQVDSDFRRQIEKYHREDVALYKQALDIRQTRLKEAVAA